MLVAMANATTIEVRNFGAMPDGTAVDLYTLRDGMVEASVCAYGARLTSVKAPDKDGVLAEVVLGHDSLEPYFSDKTYGGAVVGRCGNRLAKGQFELDGARHEIPLNNGPNSLHGGPEGFDTKLWAVALDGESIVFTLVSPDGEMGYPGNLTLSVRYSLTGGKLRLDYTAMTDKATVCNVTNHAYFNLAGESSGTILNHWMEIPAEVFTAVDETLIPTGELRPVAGTPFDFRSGAVIGDRIDADDEQLVRAGGYDHNWAFGLQGKMKETAKVTDRASGRVLVVETTEPGMQFYAGNFLDGTVPSRDGKGVVGRRTGLCLETQGYPDAVNQAGFPSVVLRPGETLTSTTVFKFETSK
jgi:aldose 1-epimerase